MRHISILIPENKYSTVNIMGCWQLLTAASQKNLEVTGQPLFSIDLVGFRNKTQLIPGTAVISPTKLTSEITSTDIIIIPAVHDDPESAIETNRELIEFIKYHYGKGAVVASLCVGAYILAATGLLDGRSCSTHWMHAEDLQLRFPLIRVKPEHTITDEERIMTSGGAYAFTHLILYLTEKYGSRELAIHLSKTFMIDLDRNAQSVYLNFSGNTNHLDETVRRVQLFLEHNLAKKITIDEIAEKHSIGRRTLERRFKNATGLSLLDYLQKLRIESAKRLLEKTGKNITEIMFNCSYSDSKAFREVFKKHTGISPQEYRNKFSTASRIYISI